MSTEPVTTPAPEPIKPFTELVGHTSPETAYTVEDYPCTASASVRRSAIGSKPARATASGSSAKRATPNARVTPGTNAKGSTYTTIRALYFNPAMGHVENDGIGGYTYETQIRAFAAQFPLSVPRSATPKRWST